MAVKGKAIIEHSVLGRLRLRFSEDYDKMPNIDKFLEIAGITDVTFDKITKSLVILYEENIITLKRLLEKIPQKFPTLKIVDGRKYYKNGYSNLLSAFIIDKTKKANTKVHSASKGAVDLGSLAPAGLFLAGMGRLLSRPVLPNWYDLMWWSYNSFLHFNPPDVKSANANGKKKK